MLLLLVVLSLLLLLLILSLCCPVLLLLILMLDFVVVGKDSEGLSYGQKQTPPPLAPRINSQRNGILPRYHTFFKTPAPSIPPAALFLPNGTVRVDPMS